jgi:hypothetical protein
MNLETKIETCTWVWCIFIKNYGKSRKNSFNSEQSRTQNCRISKELNRISKLNLEFVIFYFQFIHLQLHHNEAKMEDDYFGRILFE